MLSCTRIHAGTIRYVPNAVIDHVDAATRTVSTSAGAFRADDATRARRAIMLTAMRLFGFNSSPRLWVT